jgi:hypothetical protein
VQRALSFLILLPLALLTIACDPVPAPVAPTPPVQVEGSTLIEGDSLTVQEVLGKTVDVPGTVHAGLGWTAVNCLPNNTPGCISPTQNVHEQTMAGQVDRLVWALGSNDANIVWNGGWTIHDQLFWQDSFDILPAESCLVMVTPYAVDPHPSQAAYQAATQWIYSYAAGRPNTVVIDWSQYAILGEDGLHLALDPNGSFGISAESANARAQAYLDGLAQCQ